MGINFLTQLHSLQLLISDTLAIKLQNNPDLLASNQIGFSSN